MNTILSGLKSIWPVRSFLNYLFLRNVGDILKTPIDFNKLQYSEGSFMIPNVEINCNVSNKKKLNEMLKIGNLKIIFFHIGIVKIEIPLNFLFNKILITVSNVPFK